MNATDINDLARRLARTDLSTADVVALRQDLERYARQDLYGAARLAREVRTGDFRLPTVIAAAERINQHFEDRMRETRQPLALHSEQDKHVRQPDDRARYDGPIVGLTPHCVVQQCKESGDLIVHPRASLASTLDIEAQQRDVAISYPFKAIGGVGLVTPSEGGYEKTPDYEYGRTPLEPLAKITAQHSMEMSR